MRDTHLFDHSSMADYQREEAKHSPEMLRSARAAFALKSRIVRFGVTCLLRFRYGWPPDVRWYERVREGNGDRFVHPGPRPARWGASADGRDLRRLPAERVVHREWLTERDEDGTRLLDRERDRVREEIELGLSSGRTIIPVLPGTSISTNTATSSATSGQPARPGR
jgi:hypothetical protein